MKYCRIAGAPSQTDATDVSRPAWFEAFLADRGTRTPSVHTMKAYRQDFDAIATVIAGGDTGDVTVYTLMKLLGHESMVTSQRYVTAARRRNPHRRSPKQTLRPASRKALDQGHARP